MVVATQYNIDIFNLSNMHKLFSIDLDNSLVKIALSPGATSYYLAYTANVTKGEATIYDLGTCVKHTTINAHKNPIVQMCFDTKSTLLVTASSDVVY